MFSSSQTYQRGVDRIMYGKIKNDCTLCFWSKLTACLSLIETAEPVNIKTIAHATTQQTKDLDLAYAGVCVCMFEGITYRVS